MDPLSIAAAAVGFGEASASIGKQLKFLASIPKARPSFAAFLNELTTLHSLTFQIHDTLQLGKSNPQATPTEVPGATLEYLQRLKDITNEIDELRDRFLRDSKGLDKDGQHKIHRTRWAWVQDHKLPKLHEQIRKCRENLSISFAALNFSQGHRNTMSMVSARQAIEASSSRADDNFEALSGVMEALARDQLDTRAEVTQQLAMVLSLLTSKPQQEMGSNVESVPGENMQMTTYDTDVPTEDDFLSIETLLTRGCVQDCGCQCHNISRSSTWPWMQALVGRLFWTYNHLPMLDVRPCNKPRCRARPASSISLTYHFPAWLLPRVLHVSASVASMTGCGARLYFKVPRVISQNHNVWHYIHIGYLEGVRKLLKSGEVYPNDVMEDGLSLIYDSLSTKSHEVATLLLEFGSDPEFEDAFGLSAVKLAWVFRLHSIRSKPVITTLTGAKYAIHKQLSPIHRAVYRDDADTLEHSLRISSINLNEHDFAGRAPLHIAANRGDTTSVKVLLDHGAALEVRDIYQRTPLTFACAKSVVDVLIKAGADVHARDVFGRTPLYWMVLAAGSVEACECLLQAGADVDAKDMRGGTPLWVLCYVIRDASLSDLDSFASKARLLLSYGAGVDIRAYEANPLLIAMWCPWADELVELLWEAGASITVMAEFGTSILHLAAQHATLRRLRYMRSRNIVGVDPDAEVPGHGSPLGIFRWRQGLECGKFYTEYMTRGATPEEEEELYEMLWEIRERNWEAGLFLYSRELWALNGDCDGSVCNGDEDDNEVDDEESNQDHVQGDAVGDEDDDNEDGGHYGSGNDDGVNVGDMTKSPGGHVGADAEDGNREDVLDMESEQSGDEFVDALDHLDVN
ncbi:hypothetical protein F4780DRAFT_474240 [Xylariomycetidae sp. FL0641]|nr:hypothetical protein F4780DRAFT_474240 [Xylariomycetidae sp. FL0641]